MRPGEALELSAHSRTPAKPTRRSERLPPVHRVRRREEYQRCYRQGRRRHGALAILYFVPNELPHPRIGITVSRKVGKAVVRHRLKRRVKEIYRRWEGLEGMPALDLVVHLRPAAANSDFPSLRRDLLRVLGDLVGRGGRG